MGELELILGPAVGTLETEGEPLMFSSVSMRCAALQINHGGGRKGTDAAILARERSGKDHAGWGRRVREPRAFGGIAPLSTRARGTTPTIWCPSHGVSLSPFKLTKKPVSPARLGQPHRLWFTAVFAFSFLSGGFKGRAGSADCERPNVASVILPA
uniref:Uncharacterized protein n=1 Tax=Oryza brachyantha TaxID=4533 RepID=J3LVJ7_ORYBR